MNPRRYEFELDADSYQFYLLAEGLAEDAFPLSASEVTFAHMLCVANGIVAIGTARFGGVPASVEIFDEMPLADLDVWDHVTECGINLTSGGLLLAGGTDALLEDAKRIDVVPGHYRVRVSYGGLAEIAPDEVSPGDRYRVQLWPGQRSGPAVLKQMAAAIAARMP